MRCVGSRTAHGEAHFARALSQRFLRPAPAAPAGREIRWESSLLPLLRRSACSRGQGEWLKEGFCLPFAVWEKRKKSRGNQPSPALLWERLFIP